jgi:hypothetical protein
MKFNGRKVSGPKTDIVVIPREDGDLVFRCQAVLDYKAMEQILPRPEPKMIVRPGKPPVPDEDDPVHKEALNRYGRQKMDWMILQSLKPTEALEWETIISTDPDTWKNWEEELKDAGLTERERVEILQTILRVNSLTDEVFQQAKDRFLASQATRPE